MSTERDVPQLPSGEFAASVLPSSVLARRQDQPPTPFAPDSMTPPPIPLPPVDPVAPAPPAAGGAPAPPRVQGVQPTLMRLSDVLLAFGEEAEAAHAARVSGQPRGPISGFPALDRELSGAWLPGLHWIHGNAGTGKTAFALQVAGTCGTPALFVSCEMSPIELLRRHTARATKTFLGRLKSGELARSEAEALARQAIVTSPDLALVDATRAAAPLQFLHDAALITRGASPHILIVIDSLVRDQLLVRRFGNSM